MILDSQHGCSSVEMAMGHPKNSGSSSYREIKYVGSMRESLICVKCFVWVLTYVSPESTEKTVCHNVAVGSE